MKLTNHLKSKIPVIILLLLSCASLLVMSEKSRGKDLMSSFTMSDDYAYQAISAYGNIGKNN
ncbi:hypothetical protein ALGA_1595 [Labilibaculum antarcticum]|uniref:Uncharacterized protein n=1 Tax=Labilibaculum antarcticum TaxID=1717717 RepID=A0A1Y1CL22_9BACT|nr:hypothetical protein ALGA_1595 [Labilibaculum antarcticum]